MVNPTNSLRGTAPTGGMGILPGIPSRRFHRMSRLTWGGVFLLVMMVVTSMAAAVTPSANPSGQDASRPDSLMMVSTPTMTIDYDVAGMGWDDLSHVELWVAESPGRQWQRYALVPPGEPLVVDVPGDGHYRCCVVVQDRQGRRSPGPLEQASALAGDGGSGPAGGPVIQHVLIDTVPPRLRFSGVLTPAAAMEQSLAISLGWVGSDSYASARPVKLFYKDAGSSWRPIGQEWPAVGKLSWRPPASVELSSLVIAAVMTDQVGHTTQRVVGPFDVVSAITERSQPSEAAANSHTERSPLASTQPPSPGDVTGRVPGGVLGAGAEGVPRGPGMTGTPAAASVVDLPAEQAVILDSATRVAHWQQQAALYEQRGQWDQAVDCYRQALRVVPADLQTRLRLAGACFKAREYDSARDCYQQCLWAFPDHQSALLGLAQCQIMLQEYPRAQKTLARLLQRNPSDWQGWLMYGDVAERMGDIALARDSWRQAAVGQWETVSRMARWRLREHPVHGSKDEVEMPEQSLSMSQPGR